MSQFLIALLSTPFEKYIKHIVCHYTNEKIRTISNGRSRFKHFVVSKMIYTIVIRSIDAKAPAALINTAYWLTDLFDKSRDEEKAAAIAEKLLLIIPDHDEDSEHIRMTIGCYYSLFKKKNASREIIELAELVFNKIDTDRLIEKSTNNEYSRMILMGLFESNFGSLYVNKYKRTKDSSDLDKATAHHEKAYQIRQQLTFFSKEREYDLLVTKSNQAGLHYTKQEYAEALSVHSDILKRKQKIGMNQESIITTKRLMLGCYVKLWKSLRHEEKTRCMQFLDECKRYYEAKDPLFSPEIEACDQMINELDA